MEIKINIEKKHFYILLVVIIMSFGTLLVFAGHGDGSIISNPPAMFHYLQDVVKGDGAQLISVDSDNDGVIDKAEDADTLDGLDSTHVGKWSDATGGINYESGNVGIGTATPTQKLDVNGDINAGTITSNNLNVDMICLNGDCRTVWPEGTPPVTYLVNSVHTTDQCGAFGEVVSDGSGNDFCRINAASCPASWTQYQSWSTVTQKTFSTTGVCNNVCTQSDACVRFVSYCSAARDDEYYTYSQTWSNNPRRTCRYSTTFNNCGLTMTSAPSQVGCY